MVYRSKSSGHLIAALALLSACASTPSPSGREPAATTEERFYTQFDFTDYNSTPKKYPELIRGEIEDKLFALAGGSREEVRRFVGYTDDGAPCAISVRTDRASGAGSYRPAKLVLYFVSIVWGPASHDTGDTYHLPDPDQHAVASMNFDSIELTPFPGKYTQYRSNPTVVRAANDSQYRFVTRHPDRALTLSFDPAGRLASAAFTGPLETALLRLSGAQAQAKICRTGADQNRR